MFATTNDSLIRTIAGTFGTLIFAGACLVAAAGPAAAQETSQSKVVSYSDLNVGSTQGRNALDARIKAAAHSVCNVGAHDLISRSQEIRCYNEAVANARAQMSVSVASRG